MVANDKILLDIKELAVLASDLRRHANDLEAELKRVRTIWSAVDRHGWEPRAHLAQERLEHARTDVTKTVTGLRKHAVEIDNRIRELMPQDAPDPPPVATAPPSTDPPPYGDDPSSSSSSADDNQSVQDQVQEAMDQWLQQHAADLAPAAGAAAATTAAGDAYADRPYPDRDAAYPSNASGGPSDFSTNGSAEGFVDGRVDPGHGGSVAQTDTLSTPAESSAGTSDTASADPSAGASEVGQPLAGSEPPPGYTSPQEWQQSQGELTQALDQSGLHEAAVSLRDPANAISPDATGSLDAATLDPDLDPNQTAAGPDGTRPLDVLISSDSLSDQMKAFAANYASNGGSGDWLTDFWNMLYPSLMEWAQRWSDLTGRIHNLVVTPLTPR